MNFNNFWIVRVIRGGHWVMVRNNWMTYFDYLNISVDSIGKLEIQDEEIYPENLDN